MFAVAAVPEFRPVSSRRVNDRRKSWTGGVAHGFEEMQDAASVRGSLIDAEFLERVRASRAKSM